MTVTDIHAIWELELGFWLNGPEHYRRHVAENAMMVFPYPTGLLVGQDIVSALEEAPRWNSVDFVWKEQALREELITLAYEAVGRRDGAAPYHALCSTAYMQGDKQWKLLLHQQTPLDTAA